MSTLGRRLSALEGAAWERRKREILHDAFADVARDQQWTPDRLEREVQVSLDEFARMEPALRAMGHRGATAGEMLAYIAETGVGADDLLAEVERSGVLDRGGRP